MGDAVEIFPLVSYFLTRLGDSDNLDLSQFFSHFSMFFSFRFLGVSCCFFAVVGCQTYQSIPLNRTAHTAAWEGVRIDDQAVQKFARQLEQNNPRRVKFNPADGLTVGEAEVVALLYNPDLRVSRLKVGVAQARAEHAGRWDDPAFSFDVLKMIESVPQPWFVGAGLSLTLPISGRLAVEKSRAKVELHEELARVAEDEWETMRKLRKAWLLWSSDRARLEQGEEIVKLLKTVFDTTQKMSEAGELPRTEAALFRIEYESRRAKVEQLRGRVNEGEQELRALMGISPQAPALLRPTLVLAEVAGGAVFSENHPTLVRLRTGYEVSELALLAEIRKQYPDLEIGPSFEEEEGQSRIGLSGVIPIPILNSNKGGIAVARAQREVARGAYETELERMAGRWAATRARLEGVRNRLSSLETKLVPLVDRQVADARQLLEIGEGGSLVLLESLVRAHEAKLDLIEARYEKSEAENEIISLSGPVGWARRIR